MSQRLEINNQEIILSDQLTTITKSAYDFTDLNTRNVEITNRINLPNNAEVREILEHPEILNANNNSFEKYFPAKLYDLSLLFKGVCEIQEITKDSISVQLIDSAKELIESLKVNANSLDVDDYDFTFNIASYNDLKLLSDSIWVWPVCSHRADRKQIPAAGYVNESGIKYTRPIFSVKRLLDLSFDKSGWAFDRLITPEIDNLLLTSNHDAFYVSSYLKEVSETVTADNYLIGLFTYTHKSSEVTANNNNIVINGRKTRIRMRGNIAPAGNAEIRIEYGTESQSFFIDSNDTEINFLSDSFESDVDEVVRIYVGGSNVSFNNVRLYTVISEEDFANLDSNLTGFRVLTYENIDYDLFEIWKTSIVLFNVFFNTNRDTNTIKAQKIGSLNKFKAIDWSNKYIKDSESIDNEIIHLYRRSYLSYSNDNTLPETYGSYNFAVNSDRVEDDGNILEIPYSASYDLTNNSRVMAYLPIYGDDEGIETRVKDLGARLLYYVESGAYSIARFKDISFTELLPNFERLIESLKRPRIIECEMNLNKLDVISFDFTKLIYIDNFKSYFYVLNIKDFEPSRVTTVRLLRFS